MAWDCGRRRDVIENDMLVFNKSYFDEAYFSMPAHGSEIILYNRKISTYANALAQAGFWIEQMVEETNEKEKKAKMFPISVCFKARKL